MSEATLYMTGMSVPAHRLEVTFNLSQTVFKVVVPKSTLPHIRQLILFYY